MQEKIGSENAKEINRTRRQEEVGLTSLLTVTEKTDKKVYDSTWGSGNPTEAALILGNEVALSNLIS